MTPGRLFQVFLIRVLPRLIVALLGGAALAQADPPGRVGRLNHAEGTIVFSPAGDNEWTDAQRNRPLTRGDRLWADRGSRADIQIGSSAVRMDGRTHLEILALDDQTAQLSVTQGTLNVRVRSLPEGESFEIDTPNLAYRATYPGDYRIDVDAASGTTRITIHSGTGAVYGESGQALPLGGGQQVTFRARALAQVNMQESPPQDAFDRWAADRNRLEDQSISARYVPREVVGYQQLDAHGQWAQDATHGMVWYPRGTAANWAPYRHGHWEWNSPWGWTWIDDAPWGFAPFHYGRWTLIASRWAWVPGHLGLRPLYAPALVAFIGGGGGGVNWKISLGSGGSGVAWFPLAPGEAWQPGYRASPVYISNVNRHIAVQDNASYVYQRHAEALTAVSAENFQRGNPVRAGFVRVTANTLSNAQVVPPPPMPERSGTLTRDRAAPSQVVPPPSAEVRQVITKSAQGSAQAAQAQAQAAQAQAAQAQAAQAQAAQAQAAQAQAQAAQAAQAQAAQDQAAKNQIAQAQAQQEADAQSARQSAEQAKNQRQQVQAAEEQAKANAQPKHAGAAKPAQQATAAAAAATAAKAAPARSKEQVKHEKLAKRAEQTKREEVAVQAGQARRERQATRAEQARREQVAARAEQAKREQVAVRAEQAKRAHLARQQSKRDQAAARAEQARQQARREQQIKREQLAVRAEQSRREAQARRAQQERNEAQARRDEQLSREVHAQRVEQARRTAERDAEVLREQRVRREEQGRREAQEREAVQRQQQALADQQRRDQQLWEQQRARVRQRPDLRDDRRAPPPPPEIWQRGTPILNPGRTS
jgi:hypothetical protein